MERDGNQNSSNAPRPSSAGLLTSVNGAPAWRLPVRRPPLLVRFPLSPPPAVDRSGGAGGSRRNSKGKAVEFGHHSANINSGSINPDGGSNKNEGTGGGDGGGLGREPRREQDMYMPIANVVRIMREVLPVNVKIADDAKEAIQECVSEYISFVTAEANEGCRREKRKTITAEDLLHAMRRLGFEDYVGPLTVYLQRYRAANGGYAGRLPVKRSATDAGLFMRQNYEQYRPAQVISPSTNTMPPHSCLPPYPFFPGAGGSCCFAAAGMQRPRLRPPTPMPLGPRAPLIPLPPTVPIPLLPLAPMPLLPRAAAPVPLNYYRPEAPASRETAAEAYPDGPLYREKIAPYGSEHAPTYGDLGGHPDTAGSPSPGDDAGPSHQASISEFDAFAMYK